MMDPHLESARKRPSMYIGDVHDGSGLHHMVWEVVANAVDEHLAGRCTRIDVELGEDGSIAVDDDGGGMPVHDVDGVPFAERVLTSLHDTPTRDGHAPHEHVALRGVGLSVVCTFSTWLQLDVFRDGKHRAQRFERGVAVTPLRVIDSTTRTGTRLAFLPDPTIFSSTWINPGTVLVRLREMSYLLPNLAFSVVDRRAHRLHEPEGLSSYVRSRLPPGYATALLKVRETVGDVAVEVVAGWGSRSWYSSIESFANIARTTDGGAHVHGFLQGLVAGFKRAAPDACAGVASKRLEKILSSGLTAIVCVRLMDPTFGEPTRSRLTNPEVQTAVKASVAEAFARFVADDAPTRERILSALAGDGP